MQLACNVRHAGFGSKVAKLINRLAAAHRGRPQVGAAPCRPTLDQRGRQGANGPRLHITQLGVHCMHRIHLSKQRRGRPVSDSVSQFVLTPLGPQDLAANPTSAEFVYRRLRDAIQSGSYPPFTRLIQNQVAEQLNVSRTPVREALSRLANDDIVVWTPGRGYIVPDVTPDDVRQVHHVRRALECLGVEEAAPNYSASDIHLLRSILETAASERERGVDKFTLNLRFHLALIKPANNQVLVKLLEQLWRLPATRHIANRYLDDGEQSSRSHREHEQLIDLAELRDSAGLVKLLGEHIDHSYSHATAVISTGPGGEPAWSSDGDDLHAE